MKLLASKFNEKKSFLRSLLYARAYVCIWTLRPLFPICGCRSVLCFSVSRFVACDRNYDWRQRKTQLWRRLLKFSVRMFVKSAAKSQCSQRPLDQAGSMGSWRVSSFGSIFLPFSFLFLFHVHNSQESPRLLMLGLVHVVIAHTDQFHVILRTVSWC